MVKGFRKLEREIKKLQYFIKNLEGFGEIKLNITLTDKEIQILDSLYETMSTAGYHATHIGMDIVKKHIEVLDYFCNKLILTKRGYGDYRFTIVGFIALVFYNKKTILKTILKNFATQYKNKHDWSLDEIKNFIESQNYTEFDMLSAIQIGESLNYFECLYGGGTMLPYELKLLYNGKKYADNPINFLPDVDFDIREFNLNYKDEEILDWLKYSSHSVENFEIEYKLNIPQDSDLRRIVSGFANRSSGVLAVGFDNEGTLKGIDNPDDSERKVKVFLNKLSSVEVYFRLLKDSNDNYGLIMIVPKAKKPVLHGESLIIRDGNSFRTANAKGILEIEQNLKNTQGGQHWYISFRNYIQNRR